MNKLVKAKLAAAVLMPPAVVEQDPEANTEAMISSLASHSLRVSVRHKLLYPTDPKTGEYTWFREVVDRADVSVGETTDLITCKRIISESLAPASDDEMGNWLGELSTIAIRRGGSAEEGALAVMAYVKRLRAYPGDIVRDTLINWTGKWFPSWGELKEILDARIAPRKEIQTAVSVRAATALKTTEKNRLPDAVQNMRPLDKQEWLRFEARRAARTDPDWAKELNQQADALEAEINATGQ